MRRPPLLLAAALLLVPRLLPATTFSPETRLTTIQGQSWGPRLAASGGVLHVVWFEYAAPSFADPKIHYMRSADNGGSWSAPRVIGDVPGQLDTFPYVAASASGVYVTWQTGSTAGNIQFVRSTNDGTTFSAPAALTTNGSARSSGVSVDAQGTVHVVWYDSREGYTNVYHRQSCDGGQNFTADNWVTQFDGIVDNEQPRLVQGADGLLYLLFRTSRDGEPDGGFAPYEMYLYRGVSFGCPAGTNWFRPAQVVSRPLPLENSNEYFGNLTLGGGGRLQMAWWSQRAGNEITWRFGVPAGGGFTEVTTLSSFGYNHQQSEGTNNDYPGVAEDPSGALHVVFGEHAALAPGAGISVGRLFYRRSPNSGVSFDPLEQATSQALAAAPDLLVHNGRAHIGWYDFRVNNAGSEIWYRNTDVNNAQVASLVTHYYNNILRRAPEPEGQAAWEAEVQRAETLGIDLKEAFRVMSGQFFQSAEYLAASRTDEQYVTDLYRTFFNRDPDAPGLAFWLNELQSGSRTRQQVYIAFVFSAEFESFMTALFGDTSTRPEVSAVVDFYRGILNRLPDGEGFAFWVGRFRAAQCTSAAAVTGEVESISASFFGSAEYTARSRTNAQYVDDLYYTFLRRSQGGADLAFWVTALNTGAKSRDQERRDFIATPEFQSRVNAIIAKGCLQ